MDHSRPPVADHNDDDDEDGYDTTDCVMCLTPVSRGDMACKACWPSYVKGRVPSMWLSGRCRWWLLLGYGETRVVMPMELTFEQLWFWRDDVSLAAFLGVQSFHVLGTRHYAATIQNWGGFRRQSLSELRRRMGQGIAHLMVDLGSTITRERIRSVLEGIVLRHGPIELERPPAVDDESYKTRERAVLTETLLDAPNTIFAATALPHDLCVLVVQYWRPFEQAREYRARCAQMDAKASELAACMTKSANDIRRLFTEWCTLEMKQDTIEGVFSDVAGDVAEKYEGTLEKVQDTFKQRRGRLANQTPEHFIKMTAKAQATRKRNAAAHAKGASSPPKKKAKRT